MKIRFAVIGVTILFLTQTAVAQFGQWGRLGELTNRLTTEAAEFAEWSYRNQTTTPFRSSRSEIEAMMLAQQFSASAGLFSRMVHDRRRSQDLRDAFQILQDLTRLIERGNFQRSNWYNIQRLMGDIGRELNIGNWDDTQYPDSPRSSGRMTWKGRVDDDIRIIVRGGTAQVETLGGTPYYNATQSFTASLPPRRVNVALKVKKGRGEVFIEQQPSRENNFAAVVRIRDPRGGASDYELELSW